MTYKITLSGCLLPVLNGTYLPTTDDSKLPYVCINVETNSHIQPFLIYYKETAIKSKVHRIGIFVVPCIPQLLVHKPCWVIAELPQKEKTTNSKQNFFYPIYYYYRKIDMSNKYATQDLYNPKPLSHSTKSDDEYRWITIAGLLKNPTDLIKIEINNHVMALSPTNSISNNNLSNSSSDLIPIDETKEVTVSNNNQILKKENSETNNNNGTSDGNNNDNNDKSTSKWQYFDVEDRKCDDIGYIGMNQIIRVTDDISELEREWKASELGTHDELECFLGCVGKVIDISDDCDDTIKVQWSNSDMSWLPFRACWVTWNKNWDNYPITMPKYYYSDIEQTASDAGSSVSQEDQFTLGSPLANVNANANVNGNVNVNANANAAATETKNNDGNNSNKNEQQTQNQGGGSSKRSQKKNERLNRQNDLSLVSDLV